MPGSKFDPTLKITDGRISPAGTLVLEPDEDIIKLYAWIVQIGESKGAGAACVAFQEGGNFPFRDKWTTRGDAIHEGNFRPGQALAMAIFVSKVKAPETAIGAQKSIWSALGQQVEGSTRVYWWSETLFLTQDDRPASLAASVS